MELRQKTMRQGGSVAGRSSSGDSAYSRQLQATIAPALEKSLFLVMHSMMSSNRVQGVIELFSFILEPVQLIQTCFANPWFQFGDDFPVTQALQQFSNVASTVFPSDSYAGSLHELFVTFGIVAVVLITSAYVGFRLSYTSSSPNRALAFLRVIVLVLVSYLFMPSQEIVGKFLLPYKAPNGDWLFLVFQSENIAISPAIMVIAWIVFILFGAISTFVVTLAVTTEGFFGQGHGRADLVMMTVKTALVFITYAQPYISPSFVLLKVACGVLLCWTVLYFLSFNRLITNQLRAASMFFVLWVMVMEAARVFGLQEGPTAEVLLMGIGPMMLLGYALVWVRWRQVAAPMPPAPVLLSMVDKEQAVPTNVVRIKSCTDGDIAVRAIMYDDGVRSRTWAGLGTLCGIEGNYGSSTDEETEHNRNFQVQPAPAMEEVEDLERGETEDLIRSRRITFEGRLQIAHWLYARLYAAHPESSRLWVAYFNFCHEHRVEGRMRMSTTTIGRVNSLDLRFALFRYLFEKRRSQVGAGLGTIKYLDFTKSLRTALVYQKKAVKEIRNMWTMMLTGPSPEKLLGQLYRVASAEGVARYAYRNLLTNHSYSPQVLRSYALFLSEIHGNDAEAEKYTAMADDMDEDTERLRAPTTRTQRVLAGESDSELDASSDGKPRRSPSEARPGVSFGRPPIQASTDVGTLAATGNPSLFSEAASPIEKVVNSNAIRFAEADELVESLKLPGSAAEGLPRQRTAFSDENDTDATQQVAAGAGVVARPGTPPKRKSKVESLERDNDSYRSMPMSAMTGADVQQMHKRAEKAAAADARDDQMGVELIVPVNIVNGGSPAHKTASPQMAGIRYFRTVVLALMLATSAFLIIPVTLNVYLLIVLVDNVKIVAASVRREFLVYSAGNMVADMQSGYYYAIPYRIPIQEIIGELAYIQHHLTVCFEAGDDLTWFTQFADGVPTCTNRRSNPVGDILSTVYTVKSVVVNGSMSLAVISSEPPASDQMQYLLYALDAVAAYPLTPQLVMASRNATFGLPITDPNISIQDFATWSDTVVQGEYVLYNVQQMALDQAAVSAALLSRAHDSERAFLSALVAFAVIGIIHFFCLPFFLLHSLRYAFLEKHLGHMLLEAVPLGRLQEAMDRAAGDGRDDVTEASEMPPGTTYEDFKELSPETHGAAPPETPSEEHKSTVMTSKTFRLRPKSRLYTVLSSWVKDSKTKQTESARAGWWFKVLSACNKKRAEDAALMCQVEVNAFDDLKRAAETDGIFQSYKNQLYIYSSLLFVAELALVIVLPILYTTASMYLRQFVAIDAYVADIAEAVFTVSLYRAQQAHTLTGVPDPRMTTWYDFFHVDGLSRIQDLATSLEYYHRCIVYGCSSLDIEGVQISPTLTDYFYGTGEVDRTMKKFIQDLRGLSFNTLFTGYMQQSHALSRLLPKLYVDNFVAWADKYTLLIIICCTVVIGAVLVVTIRYYKQFVVQFSRDVRCYRFVLKLLSDEAVEELPYARTYLASSAWVDDPQWEIPAEQLMGEQDEDVQI